jgi:hypothetical protein
MIASIITKGTYTCSHGFKWSCHLEHSPYSNGYYWNIYGHNTHYKTIEEALASLPSFVKFVQAPQEIHEQFN